MVETIAPMFIPSKGRHGRPFMTWIAFMESGVSFTLVVEPSEVLLYKQAMQRARKATQCSSSVNVKIESLPKNDQGVSYARNFILTTLAKGLPKFWIMDDDIRCFSIAEKGRCVTQPARHCLEEAHRRMDVVDKVKVGLFALEYEQFAYQFNSQDVILNSYANIAVCFITANLPPDARYRFRVREDYDFALQVIKHGSCTVRFKNIAFRVPSMASTPGGMRPYYREQKKDIRLQNKLFLEAWGDVAEEVVKGTGDLTRHDIRVSWRALQDIDKAKDVLNAKRFTGFSQNPLTTNLLAPPQSSDSSDETDDDSENSDSPKPPPKTVKPRAAAIKRARVEDPQTTQREEKPKPRAEPRPPGKKGWNGWAEIQWRTVTPELARSVGLKTLDSGKHLIGQDVVFIPPVADDPVLLQGTVLGFSSGVVTISPFEPSMPLSYVKIVFEDIEPELLPIISERLDRIYSTPAESGE